jgi:four helix bundle protein
MQDFKKLDVWRLAHQLALDIYRHCDRRFSRYPGLRSQLLRAAQSIGSNIAEGAGGERVEFARYLRLALKSALEVENDLLLARDLGVLSAAEFGSLNASVDLLRRKLIALIRRVQTT